MLYVIIILGGDPYVVVDLHRLIIILIRESMCNCFATEISSRY